MAVTLVSPVTLLTNPTVTPLEMPTPGTVGDPTKPITWVGATDAPGTPGSPIQLSISPAAFNLAVDSGVAVPFSHPLTQQDLNLLVAATHVWESVANVHFNFIQDNAQHPTDIRVGLADINGSTMGQPGMTFVGDTDIIWDANNKFAPDNLVRIEDPSETPTTALSDGDQQYTGTTGTMFQTMVHELGHALGLDHNPTDPDSVMNPMSGSLLPDANDITAIQSLYGAPTHAVSFTSQADQTLYQNLTSPGVMLMTV